MSSTPRGEGPADRFRLKEAQEKLLKVAPKANVRLLQLDVSSLASVRKAAKEITNRGEPIDVLINNAAIVSSSLAPGRRRMLGLTL